MVGVLQLQQLDRPLDIRQPTAAQFGVRGRVGATGQSLSVDSGLQPTDLGGLSCGQAAHGVAHRVDHRDEPLSQVHVAGQRHRS